MFLDIFNFQITWPMVVIILTRDIMIMLLRITMKLKGTQALESNFTDFI